MYFFIKLKANRFDNAEIFMMNNGTVKTEKNIKYVSSKFLKKFFNNFNLRKYIEAKTIDSNFI